MRIVRLFVEHPAAVGETYGEHFVNASGFGLRLVLAGFACLAHALLPFLFVHTASRAVEALHARMRARRRSGEPRAPAARDLVQAAYSGTTSDR